LSSPLEKVPGVGRQRRFVLLRHFGSIDAIRSATVEEMASVKGLNRKVAEAIKKALKES
jgi:excinuclease ABC subunit C